MKKEIEKILENFDFEKTLNIIKFLNWDINNKIPDNINELRLMAKMLMNATVEYACEKTQHPVRYRLHQGYFICNFYGSIDGMTNEGAIIELLFVPEHHSTIKYEK